MPWSSKFYTFSLGATEKTKKRKMAAEPQTPEAAMPPPSSPSFRVFLHTHTRSGKAGTHIQDVKLPLALPAAGHGGFDLRSRKNNRERVSK